MDYELFDDLLPLRNEYRKVRQKEKDNSPAAAREAVLNSLSEEQKKFFESVEKQIKEKTNATKNIAKESKERAEEIQGVMIGLIQDILKDDDREEIKVSLPTGITFTRNRSLALNVSDDDKEALLEDIIDNGWYEVLDINEKAYIQKDKELNGKGDTHLFGLTPQDTTKLVIRNK